MASRAQRAVLREARRARHRLTFLQGSIQLALEELSVIYPRISHADAFAYIDTKVPKQSARYSLAQSRRNLLPPGCRMTRTHFEFA